MNISQTSTIKQCTPGIKISKSNKSKAKNSENLLTDHKYFGIITKNSLILFVASKEAKNQLDNSYSF